MHLELLLPTLRKPGGAIRRAIWPPETFIYFYNAGFDWYEKDKIVWQLWICRPPDFGGCYLRQYDITNGDIFADDWEKTEQNFSSPYKPHPTP